MPDFPQIETDLALAPRRSFQEQLRKELERMTTTATAPMTVRAKATSVGFRTLAPYITVPDPDALMAFYKEAFGAVLLDRSVGEQGGLNLIGGIGEDKFFIGGGPAAAGREKVNDLRLQVPDTDAAYRRAMDAGAISVMEPRDQPYGERNAGVKDPAGNTWWLSTRFAGSELPPGFGNLNCYLMKPNALGLIAFMKNVLGAAEIGIFNTSEGKLMHAALQIGDSMVELGEAETPAAAFYLFTDDPDAIYNRALAAGAKSLYPPADHSYGHRSCGVEDAWANVWYLAKDLTVGGIA
jgi:uncharacterized glyoxalase superfamily protein PhnB